MTIKFIMQNRSDESAHPLPNCLMLIPSTWDDYGFKTTFDTEYCNSRGELISFGSVKIGNSTLKNGSIADCMDSEFTALPDGWFSLGQDIDYYKILKDFLNENERENILRSLKDIVFDNSLIIPIKETRIFDDSITRAVSLSTIYGQFKRILHGNPVLTQFWFSYKELGTANKASVELEFIVTPLSTPPTNIHVLIGPNGVGKTTILNNMVNTLLNNKTEYNPPGYFTEKDKTLNKELPPYFFSSVVSVSFSAFDPFIPPPERPSDKAGEIGYFYIGMKKSSDINLDYPKKSFSQIPKNEDDFNEGFLKSLHACLEQPSTKERLISAIKTLENESNFNEIGFSKILQLEFSEIISQADAIIRTLSSGHKIVLISITKLVETVQEKTLLLIDEPESHLHPPLLSAFTRAISELLTDRNGVAIIATHSPVVVQEVPKSCVWKLSRLGTASRSDRPERETFGENLGILTREIFGLQVGKTGFHSILEEKVAQGGTFEDIKHEFRDKIGMEAQGILLTLIAARDKPNLI